MLQIDFLSSFLSVASPLFPISIMKRIQQPNPPAVLGKHDNHMRAKLVEDWNINHSIHFLYPSPSQLYDCSQMTGALE